MDIVIIGSGNVATVLGRKFRNAGHKILQVVSRNMTAAKNLAAEWNSVSTNYAGDINSSADFYLVAVSDQAISEVSADLKLPGKIIAHTAGSVSKTILKHVSDHYGVFYPFQSLRKEEKVLPLVPVYLDGSDDFTFQRLESLACSISPGHVYRAGDDIRLKLHVAAVLVNNFTNYLYTLAEELCKKEGIDFSELIPLIEETVARIKTMPPSASQTGPAIRNDRETIMKHLILLESYPQLKSVYEFLTTGIMAQRL